MTNGQTHRPIRPPPASRCGAVLLLLALGVLSCTDAGQRGASPADAAAARSPVVAADVLGSGSGAVPYERLLSAGTEPGNWLTYSGGYDGQRFSALDQIDRSNVHRLRLAWTYQLDATDRLEATPLVVEEVMYLTFPPDGVIALDGRTGRPYWERRRPLPDDLRLCCGPVNRGLAILGETLYWGTLDAHLVAMDAATGSVIWDVEVADHRVGHSKTGAPLALKDMIVTGIAGGEFGIRGFLDAYDARTGERRWRVYTVPGPGEMGNETWGGDAWRTGGGSTWVTGTFDVGLDLVYWGVSNPAPDYDGRSRPGDNLFTDSLLALDPDTGELRWHFQFTPHDEHDWGANQVPVLVDGPEMASGHRRLVLTANRNGFFYVLDRETGELLRASEFARQSWAEGIDAAGRPVRAEGISPSPEGTELSPPGAGATNWWSPSFSPATGLFYVMAYDGKGTYYRTQAEPRYVPGEHFRGSYAPFTQLSEDDVSAVRAIDPSTGTIRWEHRVTPLSRSGLLSTAGGLVFGGTVDGYLFALDAASGQLLWKINLGGLINAAPVTYVIEGRQRVSIAAGNAIFTFELTSP